MDNSLASRILAAAKALHSQIVAWRRQIHENPEPAFEEVRTAGLVAETLESFEIEVRRGVGKTGVLGLLRAPNARRTVALRADMDALRIREETGLPFASKRPDAGHLCGHDSHVAMLMGAAKILSGLGNDLPNSVWFLFQPAEEIPPGGAAPMIQAGALDGVDEIFGLHVDPLMPTGAIGFRSGPSMAATDEIQIRILGKGAHAAMPHMSADPIVAAAQVILALQTITSRRKDPMEPAVVSICTIHSGTQFNIIPSELTMGGTVRTLSETLRQKMPGLIEQIARAAAAAQGCQAECKYLFGYPVLCNHDSSVQKAKAAARILLGEGSDIREQPARMGGEDFALYLQKVPGAFLRIGVTNAAVKEPAALHSPKFVLDEEALWVGAALYATWACTE